MQSNAAKHTYLEQIELPAKLLDYLLWINKWCINQSAWMSGRRIPGNHGLLPNPKETYDLTLSAVIFEHLVIWNPNIGFLYQSIVQSWFTSIPSLRRSLHQHVCVNQCEARWLIISHLTGLQHCLSPLPPPGLHLLLLLPLLFLVLLPLSYVEKSTSPPTGA